MSVSDTQSSIPFVSLLTQHQGDLWAYVITLLPGDSDTADVLQKVNMVLWTKQKDFKIGTNFRAWAFAVARFEVLAHLKTKKRLGFVLLDEELLDTMANEAPDMVRPNDQRLRALEHCMRLLRKQDQELLNHRYCTNHALSELAERVGKSVSTLSVTLHRLRSALRECINRRIREEELS